MKNLWYKILSWFGGTEYYRLGGMARSPLWEKTKKDFEKISPKVCAVCGSKKVQLHHKKSFATRPELELDFQNLVWLCQGLLTRNHHIEIGHLGSFLSINKDVDEWIYNYQHRPKWNELTQMWINK